MRTKKHSVFPRNLTLLFVFGLLLTACSKSDSDFSTAKRIQISLPNYFPPFPSQPDNPMTAEGVELGRMLFFDPILSGNNKISCATCHAPHKAFTDGIALGSAGMSGTRLLRHSPTLINIAWATNGLFWDGGSTNLESQAFAPLAAHDEMDQNLFELLQELNTNPKYIEAFKKAFQDTIRINYVMKALAQFQRSLVSFQSKYDQVQQGTASFTIAESKGLAFFERNCSGCHAPPLFTDHQFHNNGLEEDFSNTDHEGVYQGRFRITFLPEDLGKFKTPSLRNIALTAPYMHDGRFSDLDAVIAHYSGGVKKSNTLSTLLFTPLQNTYGVVMSEEDKVNLKAFLKTLTDSTIAANKKFSNPFK